MIFEMISLLLSFYLRDYLRITGDLSPSVSNPSVKTKGSL